ncbi:MAG: DUF1924 domain-containing protein [Rhodospirillales bacterium]|nr:DUF1924 domain-containing protein [Rhodospirillales bacterium]
MTRPALILALVASVAGAAAAAEPARDKLLESYRQEASRATPGFAGFSAARGEALYSGTHRGGNPATPSCTTCHTADPTATGKHQKTGRAIEPIAVSANPTRFTDPGEVEKHFARDCKNVLGRDCTAEEKGDFITFLSGR